MEPEIKFAITRTILLIIALVGVGSVALAVFADMRTSSEVILGLLILLSLMAVVVMSFLSGRK